MSHLGYLIQDAWDKLAELPLDFWLWNAFVSLIAAFAVSFLGAWGNYIMRMIINRKPYFSYIPLLWVSFQFIGLWIATRDEVFLAIGAFPLSIYALIILIQQTQIPRD